jgi:hypothetical protein
VTAPGYVVIISAGEPETGLWCPDCLLPSRVRIPIYVTSETGSSLTTTADECQDCGRNFCRAPEGGQS